MTTQQRIQELFDLYVSCLEKYRKICNKDTNVSRENLEHRYNCPAYVFEQMTIHMSELLSVLEAVGTCNKWDFEKEAAKAIGKKVAEELKNAEKAAETEEPTKSTKEEEKPVTTNSRASADKEYLEMQDTINKGIKTLLDLGVDASELYDELNAIASSKERIDYLRNKYKQVKG